MKNNYLLYLIIFLSSLSASNAQTILDKGETTSRVVKDPNTIILTNGFHAVASSSGVFNAIIGEKTDISGGPSNSNAGNENPSGTTSSGTNFHDTSGNIDVDGGGQLQYTFPIALPPGIKSVAPQVNLIYSSNSTNGIAGYGWSLSGTTSISRMEKNLEKDGVIKGIDLNYNDLFQFNGQRLVLVSGEYGKDGATYKTEKFSNIRIKSVGAISGKDWNGPSYFEVTFEDGSQAWYGSTNTSINAAITPVEYNIVKWKDAQGNYISYEYIQNDNVSLISKIDWGGNETIGNPHFNSIIFNYKNRSLVETSYLNANNKGIRFIQSKLLNDITINANGSLFKKYTLAHSTSYGSNYEIVNSITEHNSSNEVANPVTFTYESSSIKEWTTTNIVDPNHDNNQGQLYGDFDGDGEIDLILKEEKSLYLYKKVFFPNSQKQLIGTLNDLTFFTLSNASTFTIKNSNNQIVPRSGFIILSQGEPDESTKKDLILRGYTLNTTTNQLNLEFEKTLSKDLYDISSNDTQMIPLEPGEVGMLTEYSTAISKSEEIDVQGDGLSELLITTRDSSCEAMYGSEYNERGELVHIIPEYSCSDFSRNIIIHLNNDNINQFVSHADDFENYIKGDFNGDGITDYLSKYSDSRLGHFEKTNSGNYTISSTSFNSNNQPLQGQIKAAVPGDFNGDGKTDLMIPKEDKSSDWILYISNGKGFEAPQAITNLAYYSKESKNTSYDKHDGIWGGCYRRTDELNNSFYAEDLDNDGKAEFISTKLIIRDHEWNEHYEDEYTEVLTSIFTTVNSTNSTLTFSVVDINNERFNKMVIPFGITSIYRDGNSTALIGKPDDCKNQSCDTFKFITIGGTQDISSIRKMNSVSQGGITTSVTYKELDNSKNPSFYEGHLLTYPYVGSERLAGSFVVAQLQQEGKKQDFYYRNMTMQMLGKGILGFQQQARSSWYANGFENTKIWSVSEMDPYNEGISNKGWKIRVSNNDTNRIFTTNFSASNQDLISYSETEYSYNYFLPNGNKFSTKPTVPTPNLITAVVPTKVISVDNLKDIRSIETVSYNDYYLPETTVANINNGYGITTTTLSYIHNENGDGKDYYIGRPLSKKIVNQAYGKSSSSYETYTYNENFISSKKIYDQNLSSFIQENYLHDGFGNLVQKDLNNSESGETKTVKTTYDSQGKFVINNTDNLGLVTSMTYNNLGQLLTEIDPLGNKTTNTYDSWGKILTSNHNLSGTLTYKYEKDSNGNINTTTYSPSGNYTINYINRLGQEYKTSTKGFNQGKIISKEIQYDAIGRKISESEPYFEGESQKWNTISYNDATFPTIISATSFTGKKVTTSVNKMVTSVKEDNGYGRTTSQETDVLGNVIRSTDTGGSITFTYNAANQQTSATYGSNVVTTKYDNWGRKSEFHDPSNGLYKYFYDGFGNPIRTESPKGKKEYSYNTQGQLISQTETANDGSTAKNINYTYNTKGLLVKKAGTAKNIKGTLVNYSSTVTYDTQGRVVESGETSNGRHFMQKDVTYDDKGRVTSYEKSLYSGGKYTKALIENVYNTWSGTLYQAKDKSSGTILWQLDEVLAGGQVTKTKLGKSAINNLYDYNNMLSSIQHTSVTSPQIVDIAYSFDAIKNELTSRITSGNFSIIEGFNYDNNNRLVEWTNPATGNMHKNVYDQQGRITENNQIGKINFGGLGSVYRPTSIDLNTEGIQHYTNDQIQTIGYNENNDPTFINGVTGDAAFSYGLTNMRQVVSYGGNFSTATEGKFTKFYSEDGSFEVTIDNTTRQEKHILYIGGSPYEADILYLKDFTKNEASYHYLHKDYLGSILAITDENGKKLEQRHYDAWGNITHLKVGTGAVITDKALIKQTALLLDRGYTSHEHFQELGIIHMNGRLYDPILRRFLNADENIQEPFNTQNYNKYGYVFNNPLIFNDPSGEFAWFAPLIPLIIKGAAIGAAIGLATYTFGVAINGQKWNIKGALKSIMQGAISGAISAGMDPGIFGTSIGITKYVTSQLISTILPSFDFSIGDFDFSISPSIALGKGWGVGANFSATFHAGDFSLSAGFGIMNYGSHQGSGSSGWEYRKSKMIGYNSKAFGINLGTNQWEGLHAQQTGILKLSSGDFSLTYENDGTPFQKDVNKLYNFGDGGDSYRTAAASISYKGYSIGFNLFTGLRDHDSYKLENSGAWDKVEGEIGNPIYKNGIYYKNGLVYEKGYPSERYRLGAAYFGYKNYRIGIDSDRHIRHTIQNRWTHNSKLANQRAFEVLDFSTKPYLQYQTQNKFTSW
ncbi:polymorphic toxin type 23 domain-containing protein [Chishuiella changwenlii]|uniref:polymorphic toxin type 23 domain-containing protein n=1 Tax=Chishuiella changwenlii TaxID=1434701 RepID=UPI002FDAFA24